MLDLNKDLKGLLALDSKNINAQSVLQTAIALERLANKGVAVRLAWVKAHVGLEGNDPANSEAKQGGKDEMNINRRHYVPMSKAEAKGLLNSQIREQWKRKWQSYPGYRMTKQFLSEPNKTVGLKAIKLSKSSLGRLIQLITGHNFLSYYQYKIDASINPLCLMCGEENETFYHLLVSCPAMELRRRELFLDCHPSLMAGNHESCWISHMRSQLTAG